MQLVDLLLENRGIFKPEEKEKFLNPSYEGDLHDPYLMKDMERACVRIFEAIQAKEKIVIYSDYDCDGIPGAVILHDLFKKIGYGNFENYIPDRHKEGFGLHQPAIDEFIKSETKLLITVDLGITDVEEVAQAESSGINVIISDHHITPEILPPAYAILNPKQAGDEYPFKELCGAGVAFKLVQAFIKKYGEYFEKTSPSTGSTSSPQAAPRTTRLTAGWEKWLLDMAALATLSDQVPLLGENRALAFYGLKVLRKNRRLGLEKLFSKNRVDLSNLTEDDITFTLAPRLNAASRMESPRIAFDLVTTNDENKAEELSERLSEINNQRKILVAGIMKEVKKNLAKREEKSLIVIGNPAWRVGVLGLVASKIADEYERPCFVWGSAGARPGLAPAFKGSCRSDGSVNVVGLMRELEADTLLDYGGHDMAGGFSVSQSQVYFLEANLLAACQKIGQTDGSTMLTTSQRRCEFDAKLSLKDVTMENYEAIQKLAPFGTGNPKPVFLFEGVEVSGIKKFGKNNEHLEIVLEEKVKAIQFFKNEKSFTKPIAVGEKINLLANLEKNVFRNKTELRLKIIDIL
ncbi:single-stranded-DNA-specific exonuclease RecJ [Candidatus Nomurabacteria bacterium RIFCSPHIGHO2_01_FULL_42_16]|uniref:Single-stranded-DNA-specific exonuclease RecJ n=1 Tax=Candidatus Nomurabacteria bacterium RIFCSPHIGHO2_01_FULL_42_16 TaxID=1801743 RepID=A0A1F6VLV9_9BACT|nr:MAG: single-stranded-DNA-specific exonuclease RecJ [Candidatus Nomurabacteria bacterium RIFCSPHIGHO2_01_FULL_42_16]